MSVTLLKFKHCVFQDS